MAVDDLDEGLLGHLVVEFLDHGRRAVGFLRSARALLVAPPVDAPHVADMVAYCLREAMKAIPASQETGGGGGQWRTRSRRVVEAKQQYERVKDLPGEDSSVALQELLARIDDMALTHQEASVHQKRLIAVVVNRTGVQPLVSGMDPVGFYQDVLSRLDQAVHDRATMDEARKLWTDCLAILRQLFLPPDVRNAELDALASMDNPGADDVPALIALLASPNHLHYFLSKIATPAWLTVLADTALLEPPAGQAGWPVFAAVERLKDDHDVEVATVLLGMMGRWGSDSQRAWYIARAAFDLGSHGRNVVLSALRKHPSSQGISSFTAMAATSGDAADPFVETVANIVLNTQTWTPYPDPLLTALVEGMTPDNSIARIKLLSYKLRAIPPDDHDRRWFHYSARGRLDDEVPDYQQRKPFYLLLRTLILALHEAGKRVDARALLEAIAPIPDDIKERVRIWILATTSSVEQTDLVVAIAEAVSSRYPTSDDLRLVNRIVAESSEEDYLPVWMAAVGEPPSVAELSEALAADAVPQPHRYIFGWSAILPQPVKANWTTALAIMSAAYGGGPTRESLEQPTPAISGGFYHSPISAGDLRAMPPEEAASWIAAWQADPSQGLVSSLELARTLQTVVKEDTATWVNAPIATASLLRHPTYINHYIQGLAESESLTGASPTELVDLILLVRAHPWPAITLGSDPDDFDHNWRAAERACIQLIKKMAASDLGFDSKNDDIWEILRTETENSSEPSGVLGDNLNPLETAINRPCTQALEAVLFFLSYEYNKLDGTVRQEALDLLSSILQLDGRTGAEHRAILATRIGFLRHIAPDWFEQHRGEVFGDAAPSGLGQVTMDLALRWGQSNKWLVEKYPALVKDAVARQVENALERYLVAMLWSFPGYSVQDAIGFLKSRALLSSAGQAVGRLLRAGDASVELTDVAIQFWTAALNAKAPDALAGFGWYAEIPNIDANTWTDLTLKTVTMTHGRIHWAHKNAERAAAQPTTPKILDILNHLVRGITDDEWDRREITKIAAQTLQQAQDLAETSEYKRLHTTLSERGAL